MPSLPIVIIWLLAITLGGLMITGAFLIVTRDTGQRASGQRVTWRQRQATLERWQRNLDAAKAHMEARSTRPAMAPVRPWNEDGSWAHATCPECGVSWDLPSPDCPHLIWNCHPLAPLPANYPLPGERAEKRLTHDMIEASIRRVYAESERRQVLQLARTAWATWQG